MILGIGTDIIENNRIAEVYRQHQLRFLNRIYTPSEIEYALARINPVPYLAVRFSAKEAAFKALQVTNEFQVGWKDMEIAGKQFGPKTLIFYNDALAIINKKGINKVHFSLSHCENYSTATVILEKI